MLLISTVDHNHIWQLCTCHEYHSYLGGHMEVTQTHSQHFMNTTDHRNQKYLQRVWQKWAWQKWVSRVVLPDIGKVLDKLNMYFTVFSFPTQFFILISNPVFHPHSQSSFPASFPTQFFILIPNPVSILIPNPVFQPHSQFYSITCPVMSSLVLRL